jgi:hypothetical protein
MARRPVPAANDQDKSRKLMKEAFAAELNDGSPSARRALAHHLLDEEAKMHDVPADRFVVLGGAIQSAVEAADLPLAFEAADRMADGYLLDSLQVKASAAMKIPPKAYAANADNVQAALALLDALESAEDFADVSRLVTLLQQVRVSDLSLRNSLPRRAKEIEEVRAAAERVPAALEKLKTSPADPDANSTVGQYTALLRGDWDHGLPFLAKGGDAKLAALARTALADPPGADARAKLADGWWDLADATSGVANLRLLKRAADDYQLALPGLTGLERVLAEKRISGAHAVAAGAGVAAANLTPGTVHLLSLIDDKDLALAGWTRQEAAVVSDVREGSLLTLPYLAPDEYDLTVEFSRLSGDGDIALAFPVGRGTCDFVIGAHKNLKACLGRINGKFADGGNPTLTDASVANNERHRMEVKVRRDGVEGYLDGKRLCYWKTNGDDLLSQRFFMPRSPGLLGIGSYESNTAFYSAEVTPLHGTLRQAQDCAGAIARERDSDGWIYNPIVLRPSAAGDIQLPGRDATVHGRKTTFDGQQALAHWESANDYVTWFVDAPKATDYTVEVTYACEDDHAGSDVEIGLGATKDGVPGRSLFALHVQGTGGWTQFKPESVGKLHLPAGRQTLWAKVKSMPRGAVMNLRQIVLTPVSP